MRKVPIDFETASTVDIKKFGGAAYVRHPSTIVHCAVFIPPGQDKWVLVTRKDLETNAPSAQLLRLLVEEALTCDDLVFEAHNAAFERGIWRHIMVKRFGFPELPIHKWFCTMAKARSFGCPSSLEEAALFLRLPVQKDKDGYKVMLKLCKPKDGGTYWTPEEVPEDFRKLYDYCAVDVLTQVGISQALPDLSPREQAIWAENERMNDEGVYCDIELAKRVVALCEEEKSKIFQEFQKTTGTTLTPRQRTKIKQWAKEQGYDLPDTKATTIRKLEEEFSPLLKKAFALVEKANKASVAKFNKILLQCDATGIIYDILAYHKASTGRYAGQGAQFQNMKRPPGKFNMNRTIEIVMSASLPLLTVLYPNVMEIFANITRGVIIAPPGKRLMVVDYASMEMRILTWIVENAEKLQQIREGVDVYCKAASVIYGYECNPKDHKDERFVGKVAELALGYNGGIGALVRMADMYGLDLAPLFSKLWINSTFDEREKAEYAYKDYLRKFYLDEDNEGYTPAPPEVGLTADIIKQRWRAANPLVVRYWKQIESAAADAIESRSPVQVGKLTFFMYRNFLMVKLPSGRTMAYPYPRVEADEKGRRKVVYWSGDKKKNIPKYGCPTYGGKLVENIVQAIQRDLTVYGILKVRRTKYQIYFHVHDEFVAAVPIGEGSLEEFERLMSEGDTWTEGLPIAVEGWEGPRYGKAA